MSEISIHQDIYSLFELSMCNLIDCNLLRQKEILNKFNIVYNIKTVRHAREYIKEHLTVKISAGRRSGHTTCMIDVGKEMFDNAIFVFPTNEMKNQVMKSGGHRGYCVGEFDPTYFRSVNKFRGIKIDAVFIDCATHIDKNKIDDVIDIILPHVFNNDKFCLVLVQ